VFLFDTHCIVRWFIPSVCHCSGKWKN
jgi:hypothetical protein